MSPVEYHPANEMELAKAIGACAQAGIALDIVGGGTRPVGNPAAAQKKLFTGRMRGISLYEPEALTMIVRAGTPLAEVEEALASKKQRLAFEPGDWGPLLSADGASTIGGVVAAGVSGPRRIQAGAARDALIGVRFVTGAGEVAKSGGRVMKNVTGYDLSKLLCGSWGTLGVLTELSFKVAAIPEACATVRVRGCDEAGAIGLMAAATNSPFDISGAAHLADEKSPTTVVRVEGLKPSVAYRAERLRELLGKKAPAKAEIDILTGVAANRSLWQKIRDVSAFARRDGSVWRLSVRPSKAAAIVAALRREYRLEAIYDWAGGLVWLLIGEAGPVGVTLIRSLVDQAGGHATLIRGDGNFASVPAFHPQPPAVAALAARLRAKFDPFGILNPGRMAPILATRRAG